VIALALSSIFLLGMGAYGVGGRLGWIKEYQIKQDYATANGMNADDVVIHGYYGTYSNQVVLSLGDMTSVIKDVSGGTETVAGKTFIYAQPGYRIVVWNEGNFYSLTEQHEQGLLTNANIETIWNLYQK